MMFPARRLFRASPVAALLLCAGVLLWRLFPAPVSAQGDILDNPVCRSNPYAEECVCRDVFKEKWLPKIWNPATPLEAGDWDNDGNTSSLSAVGSWSGDDDDLWRAKNDRYEAECSLEYFRENLRRLWYFTVAFGGGLLSITLAWAGFVHIQDVAFGERRAQERSQSMIIVVRGFVGIILLASAFIAWEGISTFLFDALDIWGSQVPERLEIPI